MGTSFSSDVGYNSTAIAATSNLHTIFNASNQLTVETYTKNATMFEDEIPLGAFPMDVMIAIFASDKSLYDLIHGYNMTTAELIDEYAEWKYSHGKPLAILKSTSGIISLISSSIFIWMIMRSHDRLSTTLNRILLGLCISDIIHSLSWSTFNVHAPSEYDYFIWNARGNQTTSDVQGFLLTLGMFGGLFYNASLNSYFLAVVKYKKSKEFIRAKIEPLLHILPIAVAISYSIYLLVKEQYNDDGAVIYEPVNALPHCWGYDVEEVRKGFEIPCYRGYEHVWIAFISRLVLMFVPAVIIVVSLGMIYSDVRTQEQRLARYGVGALRSNLQLQSASTRSNNMQSQSRAVMHKAFGYSFAWLLSYGIYLITMAAGIFSLTTTYINDICLPLQGFFNLLIFMHPKIMAARRRSTGQRGGENVSWCNAFSTAFWSRGAGGDRNQGTRSRSNRRGRNQGTCRSNQRDGNTASCRSNQGGRNQGTCRSNLRGRRNRPVRNTRNEDAAAGSVTIPHPSTEITTARDVNLSTDDMVEMRNMNFVENGNGGNALSDIAEDPNEDTILNQDEEEGMNEAEMGKKDIVPMAAADVNEPKEISMEDEDEGKEKKISTDEEEEMNDVEKGIKDTVPTAAADANKQNEIQMENEDEEKEMSTDEEEGMSEAEMGKKDIVPMAAADVNEPEEISMEDEDEAKEMSADDESKLPSVNTTAVDSEQKEE